MSAGFTPGPWETAKSNCGYNNVTVGSYLYTPRWTGIAHTPELEANARLIAAAPELYSALATVLAYYEGEKPYDFHHLPDEQRANDTFDAWQSIAEQARAALAKAVQS